MKNPTWDLTRAEELEVLSELLTTAIQLNTSSNVLGKLAKVIQLSERLLKSEESATLLPGVS
jgi:hypothetical protein